MKTTLTDFDLLGEAAASENVGTQSVSAGGKIFVDIGKANMNVRPPCALVWFTG